MWVIVSGAAANVICNKRFTTYEQVESFPILVLKTESENPDRNKLLRGCLRPAAPVSADEVEAIAIEIEQAVRNSLERFHSGAGEMVMERLYKLDEVAYVRFASVYRQFRDVNSFTGRFRSQQDVRWAGDNARRFYAPA